MGNYMQDTVNALAILALGLVFVARVRTLLRTPRDRSLQILVVLAGSMTAVVVIGNRAVYAAVDAVSGVPHLAQLLMQMLSAVSACAMQIWVLHWTHPAEQARRRSPVRLAAMVCAVVLLAVFFTLAPIDREVPRFLDAYATAPWMGPYYLVFLGYLGFTFADLSRMSWRYTAIADNPLLRFGLRLISAGALSGVLYAVNTGAFTLGGMAGFTPGWSFELANRITQAGAIFPIVLGATCSAWAVALTRWWASYRRYAQLHPLWTVMTVAFPGLPLDPQPSPWLLPLHLSAQRLRYRVARKVTEIHDGFLRLRPHLGPVRRSTPEIAAEEIAEALRAFGCGAAPAPARTTVAAEEGGVDLDGEIEWLAQVSAAFTRRARGARPSPTRAG